MELVQEWMQTLHNFEGAFHMQGGAELSQHSDLAYFCRAVHRSVLINDALVYKSLEAFFGCLMKG